MQQTKTNQTESTNNQYIDNDDEVFSELKFRDDHFANNKVTVITELFSKSVMCALCTKIIYGLYCKFKEERKRCPSAKIWLCSAVTGLYSIYYFRKKGYYGPVIRAFLLGAFAQINTMLIT